MDDETDPKRAVRELKRGRIRLTDWAKHVLKVSTRQAYNIMRRRGMSFVWFDGERWIDPLENAVQQSRPPRQRPKSDVPQPGKRARGRPRLYAAPEPKPPAPRRRTPT